MVFMLLLQVDPHFKVFYQRIAIPCVWIPPQKESGTNETQDPLMAVFNTLSLEVSCSRDEATSLSSSSRPVKKYKLKKDNGSLSFRTHIFIGREHNLYCKCISVLCDHMKGRPNLMKDFSDYHSIKEERFKFRNLQRVKPSGRFYTLTGKI